MGAADLGGGVEVGDGARDAQHAVVAARGQVHALGGAQQQLAAGAIGLADPREKRFQALTRHARRRRMVSQRRKDGFEKSKARRLVSRDPGWRA